MPGKRRSLLIDARVNALPGAHGLARSVMKLLAHMPEPEDGLVLRALVNPGEEQLFPLFDLPGHIDLIGSDVGVLAQHRSWELAAQIRAADAAVMYVPYPTLTPLVRPCPFVVTVHDCTIEDSADFAGGRIRQTLTKTVTAMALRRAAAMTAPSRASLAGLRRHYPAAPHPTLIPNGVDVGQFGEVTAAAVADVRARYHLPDTFVLAVGAHRPHKNHEVLVRALAALPEDVSLVIVGHPDPSFRSAVPRLIAELGLASRVRLLPDVADEWLPALYRAASVFAFPSLSEGYGLPALEAMAAGVPVVASDIDVMAEVAGTAAVLVSPRDEARWASAIAAVLRDPAYARRLITAGHATAASAGWERGAMALSDLLCAVAAGRLTAAGTATRDQVPPRPADYSAVG